MRNIASEIGLERVAAVVDEFSPAGAAGSALVAAICRGARLASVQTAPDAFLVGVAGWRALCQLSIPGASQTRGCRFYPGTAGYLALPLFSATLHDLLPARAGCHGCSARKNRYSLRVHQFYHGADAQPTRRPSASPACRPEERTDVGPDHFSCRLYHCRIGADVFYLVATAQCIERR